MFRNLASVTHPFSVDSFLFVSFLQTCSSEDQSTSIEIYLIIEFFNFQAITFSNIYAPEHLIINVKNAEKWESFIENAGRAYIYALMFTVCIYSVLKKNSVSN